jgi:hypothetical protein
MSFRENKVTGYWTAFYSGYSAQGLTKKEALNNVLKVVRGVIR